MEVLYHVLIMLPVFEPPVYWSTSLLWISGYEKESQGKKSLEEIMSQSLTKYDNYTNLKTPKQNKKKFKK